MGTRGNGVPTPFFTTVTFLEDFDFSFQFVHIADMGTAVLCLKLVLYYMQGYIVEFRCPR